MRAIIASDAGAAACIDAQGIVDVGTVFNNTRSAQSITAIPDAINKWNEGMCAASACR